VVIGYWLVLYRCEFYTGIILLFEAWIECVNEVIEL